MNNKKLNFSASSTNKKTKKNTKIKQKKRKNDFNMSNGSAFPKPFLQ